MHIKIEIDCKTVNLRKYVAQTITKEVVKILYKREQKWYKEEPIEYELENASIGRLIKCWLKNVWPGTNRYRQCTQQKGVQNGN